MRSRERDTAGRRPVRLVVAAVLAGLAAGFLITEIALRSAGLSYGTVPLDPHPVFHHWHPANLSFRAWSATGEYGGFNVHFNNLGMVSSRELTARSEEGIVILGDSFVGAVNVPEEGQLSSVIERELGVRTFNLGASSFSPLLSLLLFRSFTERIRPSAVVEVTYANDLVNDHNYRAAATVVNGEIVAVPGPTGLRSTLTFATRRSYVLRLARVAWEIYLMRGEVRRRLGTIPQRDEWLPYFDKPIALGQPEADVQFTDRNIVTLAGTARRSGAPFYLTAVPDRGAALHGTPDFYNEHMKALAARESIDYIDLVPAFRQAGVGALYYPRDIHWNRAGQQLAGSIIARRIRAGIARDGAQ